MPTAPPLPPAAVIVRSQVRDFDTWLEGFDTHEDERRAAGILGHHINRAEDDPNDVSVYLALADLDEAKTFLASDRIRDRMEASGVLGAPEYLYMHPVREAIVWDRPLPALIVRHSVVDFERWLEGYDATGARFATKGIVGRAANRAIDYPAVVVLYHQAESFETLRLLLEDGEFQAGVAGAGLTSELEVQFVWGGWAKRYS